MSEHELPLDRLALQAKRLPDRPSGLLDLARALTDQPADPEQDTCTACREALHKYIEAELNGEPVRRLFPKLSRHLDRCPTCGPVYVDLLQVALEAEKEPLPVPTPTPALDLSFLPPLSSAERTRGVIEMLSKELMHRLSPQFVLDLPAASQRFFRQLGEVGVAAKFQQAPDFSLAFGAGMSPPFQTVAAAYTATGQAIHTLSDKELAAELSGDRPPNALRKLARAAARSTGLRRNKANQWAKEYVALAQAHAAEILALASQMPNGEKAD